MKWSIYIPSGSFYIQTFKTIFPIFFSHKSVNCYNFRALAADVIQDCLVLLIATVEWVLNERDLNCTKKLNEI